MVALNFGVKSTKRIADLFTRLDAVLPEGEKTQDFFKALEFDIIDLVLAGESVGIDKEDFLGEELIITASIEPSSDLEAAYLMLRQAREKAEQEKEVKQ